MAEKKFRHRNCAEAVFTTYHQALYWLSIVIESISLEKRYGQMTIENQLLFFIT